MFKVSAARDSMSVSSQTHFFPASLCNFKDDPRPLCLTPSTRTTLLSFRPTWKVQ